MTSEERNDACQQIIKLLDRRELKRAFAAINEMTAFDESGLAAKTLRQIENAYQAILKSQLENNEPEIETHQSYYTLVHESYQLADSLRYNVLIKDSPLLFYAKCRVFSEQQQVEFDQIAEWLRACYREGKKKEAELIVVTLFYRAWLLISFSEKDVNDIRNIFRSDLPPVVICQIVSGLLMGLQVSFDERKLFLLFNALELKSCDIRAKALTAVLITLYTYRHRLDAYPQVAIRLAALSRKRPSLSSDMRTVFLRLLLSRETEKISKTLQRVIFPEMQKLHDTMQKMFDNLTEAEKAEKAMSPDVQKLLNQNSFMKRMEKIIYLQDEGADINHCLFASLKKFFFFQDLSNWFLPFVTDHSLIEEISSSSKILRQQLEALRQTNTLCDSDKYSLFFSMVLAPNEQEKMRLIRLLSEETLETLQLIEEGEDIEQDSMGLAAGRYIKDLYRFFKVYPMRADFKNIFRFEWDFYSLPILDPYLSDKKSLIRIAEYYLEKKYFIPATDLFKRAIQKDPGNDVLYQQAGYCYLMRGNFSEALDFYLKADLLNSDNKRTIWQIAACYRSMKYLDEELSYLFRYETLEPEDPETPILIGNCYNNLKNYPQALKYYFKADYMEENNPVVWRAIAWASFSVEKYAQSRKYHKKILKHSPDSYDYLTAGNTEWAMNNPQGALQYYLLGVKAEGNDVSRFIMSLFLQVPSLRSIGIEEYQVKLMVDQIRYSMESADPAQSATRE